MFAAKDRSDSSTHKPVILKHFPPKLLNSPYLPSNDIKDLVKFSKYIKNDKKMRLSKSKSASIHVRRTNKDVIEQKRFYSSQNRSHKSNTNNKTWRHAIDMADKASQANKIFSCEAPYPVDLFVRMSMRRRGWVEKFGVKLNRAASYLDKLSSINCDQLDMEVIQLICSEKYPRVWEENDGLYYIASSCVKQNHATFVWGNKSVNSMLLRDDVFVNHFPKSKYFSSKILLATCLRDLVWHNEFHCNFFFPRCYLLNESDLIDFIEDFQLTACMGLLKHVLLSNGFNEEEFKGQDRSNEEDEVNTIILSHSFNQSEVMNINRVKNRTSSSSSSSQFGEDDYDDDFDDDNDDYLRKYEKKYTKVLPDLMSMMRIKKGGVIPKQCLEWAMIHCRNFLEFKTHKDIDSKKIKHLQPNEMNQLMDWCLQVSQEGASVEQLSDAKLDSCLQLLQQLKIVWQQFNIDGTKNLWIIKPGDMSKGIGISMSNNLKDILSHFSKQSNHEYVIQKYIERPLLLYKCKFDIRQWFLVTSWLPLTIWMYKHSYLRICSQEFNYETLHESVHLSNVAVQENYLNGVRSNKIPENNFMTSDDFKEYLREIGRKKKWDDKIYPGMKMAVINTLISTQEFVDSRKNGFELYGADFMLSEDFQPWLLEINSSPGMCPTCPEKVKLCSSVIEDTIRVVLDELEEASDNVGGFELIHQSFTNPNTKGTTNRLLLEGSQIKRNCLLKYSAIDKKAAAMERVSDQRE